MENMEYGELIYQVLTSKDFPNDQFGVDNLPNLVLHILSYRDAPLIFGYVILCFRHGPLVSNEPG